MALVVNTNVASIQAQYNVNKTNQEMSQAMERLSSGSRINSAADDAAGLSIASRMESQVRGLSMAIRNANDGISLAQSAEGAMEEITAMLQRMRELAIQGANSVNNAQDREALDAEVQQLKAEIDRISATSTFNAQNILDGTFQGAQLQVGMNAAETINFNLADMSTSGIGGTALVNSSLASTQASAEGTAATETVARLAFSGPDTYSFKVSGVTVSGTLTAAAMSSDLRDLANTINSNLTEANVTNITAASRNGAIELRNTEGDSISVTTFTSSGNGTAQFDVVTGGGDSVFLNDKASITDSTTALGTEASSTGVSLKLEDGGEYSFKLNGAQVSLDGTEDDAAVKAKLAAALGAGYEVYANGDDASADFAAASTGHDAGDDVHTTADKYVIFHADSGKAINITQFSALDGEVAGTQGTIRTTGGGTEALLVDATNQFTVADAGAGEITEMDLAFSSSTTDYEITIDEVVVYVSGDDLASGLAGQRVIDQLNEGFADGDNASTDSAAGLGSLGNDNTGDLGGDGDTYTYEIVQNGLNINIKKAGTADSDDLNVTINDVDAAGLEAAVLFDGTGADGVAASARNGGGAVTVGSALTVFAAVAESTGDFVVNADNGSEVAASEISLNETAAAVFTTETATETKATLAFSGNGTFTFKVTDGVNTTASLTTSVVGGSASQVVADLNALFDADGNFTDLIEATIDPNDSQSVILTRTDGKAIALNDFSTNDSGTILFSPSSGQGTSVLLDDNDFETSGTASAAGLADATEATMEFSADDFVSFRISDGVSIGTVRRVSTDVANDGALLLAEVNSALNQAGIADISATVTETGGKVKLAFENSKGGVIEVTAFESDSSTTATFAPASGQGVAKILDDNSGNQSNGKTISTIDILSASAANAAMEVIDNAIQQVNDERAKLGAIQNRLDHTVNNLGNIVTNTEASKSRIQDADFAAESAKLAKNQILLQAGTAMLAQANASQQTVLSLLG